MKNETPIRRQYLEIKAQHTDAILLFRLGDFYEAFDADARLLSKELDIALTSKPMGKNMRVPLAGIPYHVLDKHLATLISRGHRVAICEQTSSAPVKDSEGKRLIQREVVRTVTAGTILEPELLNSKINNYLVSFYSDGHSAGIAYADVTTGDFAATEVQNKDALTEIQRLAPAEIIIANSQESFSNRDLPHFVTKLDADCFSLARAAKSILNHFQTASLKPFGLENSPLATAAAGALIEYLKSTQGELSGQLTRLTTYDFKDFMVLDEKTFLSLEVFESQSGSSLISVIDRTQTSMGSRMIRRWLRQPLLDCSEIYRRQDHIEWFVNNPESREGLQCILTEIKDLERLSSRAKANSISAPELRALGVSLTYISKIKKILRHDAVRFGQTIAHLPECEKASSIISNAISNELPQRAHEQKFVIRSGFSDELDKLRHTLKNGKAFLADLEKRERQRTGIKSLRVNFNKVFGYYIEVTKPNLHLVPADYTRKQTLIPAERFITLELKEYESLVFHAEERIAELENSLFRQVCQVVGENRQEILLAANTIAYLDAICSLSELAETANYVRPTVNETSLLRVKNGRHPVIEQILHTKQTGFISNDTALGGNAAPQIGLITGPNASGKSTYLRQVAVIVLLAQIGSFVPAEEAVIGICDRIFTRFGLYDRIGSGESTFMTEMVETAEILHNASQNSLILLDELGRGTSTYDGLAVARSVIEYIHNHPKLKARTLFATHYHELAELARLLPGLENYYFVIEESEDTLKFKYSMRRGTALKSYGVYAAKLAGLPKPVITRAEYLLNQYDNDEFNKTAPNLQLSINSDLLKRLNEIDTDSLSPVEALMKIYELKGLIKTNETKAFTELKKATG